MSMFDFDVLKRGVPESEVLDWWPPDVNIFDTGPSLIVCQ